ncbi:unnamed protein product [marine sediment metagenome]|uniref:Uncharacterized protein n=1 Tax=marine sediment metagenome TaxID=412755 RepID=X0YN26_9ZZZZ
MDLALTIEKLDPKARYLLNHSEDDGYQVILEWRGPGTLPKQAELDLAWSLVLKDQADLAIIEQERQAALLRVKADAALADIVKVLDL